MKEKKPKRLLVNLCVCCGKVEVPEGGMVCPNCIHKSKSNNKKKK